MTAKERGVRGFSLVELMFVASIITILAGMALNYSGNFNREERLKEVARAVVSALSLGRAEATRRSTSVTVTFASQVIMAFIDSNGNRVWDNGETVIYRYPSVSGTINSAVSVTASSFTANGTVAAAVVYTYQGLSVFPDTTPAAGVVCVKDSGLTDVRAVQVTIAGGERIQSQAAGKALCP